MSREVWHVIELIIFWGYCVPVFVMLAALTASPLFWDKNVRR